MRVELLTFGHGLTNCYLASCEESLEAMILDPYFSEEESNGLIDKISDEGLSLKFIVNTHGHPDHMSGNHWLRRATDAKIMIHRGDADMLATPWKAWEAWDLSVPRPCPICEMTVRRFLEINEAEGYAEVGCTNCGPVMRAFPSPPGDILLEHNDVFDIGHTSFQVLHTPGHTPGSVCFYSKELSVVFTGDTLVVDSEILMGLPASTMVYPGHGKSATIEDERRG